MKLNMYKKTIDFSFQFATEYNNREKHIKKYTHKLFINAALYWKSYWNFHVLDTMKHLVVCHLIFFISLIDFC